MRSSELIKLAAARIVMQKQAWVMPAAMGLMTLMGIGKDIYGMVNEHKLQNSPVAKLEQLMGIGNIMDSMGRSGIGNMFGNDVLNQMGSQAINQYTGQNIDLGAPAPRPTVVKPPRSTSTVANTLA